MRIVIGEFLNSGSATLSFTFPYSENMVLINPTDLTEEKTIDIDCECLDNCITLSWLNKFGGFDHWTFKHYKDHQVDIKESQVRNKNIFPNWPNSYGATSDTIRQETYRKSSKKYTIRGEGLTEQQVEGIATLKESPLVQIVESEYDRRTVLVDTDSFIKFKDGDKTFQISFIIEHTDLTASQSL